MIPLAFASYVTDTRVVDCSDSKRLEPLTSPGELSETSPSSSSSRNNLRSAGMSAPTFIENVEHVSAVASQHGEGAEEEPQSGSTR